MHTLLKSRREHAEAPVSGPRSSSLSPLTENPAPESTVEQALGSPAAAVVDPSTQAPEATHTEAREFAAGHDFGRIPVFAKANPSPPPDVTSTIAVSQPGDPYEREADRVADQVMRMPDPANSSEASAGVEVATSSMHQVARSGGTGGSSTVSELSGLDSGGSPLSPHARSYMEPRFGADFSQVRVHTGPQAAQMNRAMGSLAFAYQQDIYFGEGRSPSDHHLLAHELTHTLQQTGNAHLKLIQRAIGPSFPVPSGEFKVTNTPGLGNLPITIQFHPSVDAPYSNQIGLIQIVKLQSPSGTNIEPVSLPAARGASLRTTADAASGVQGGFFTDVLHNDAPATGGAGTDAPAGSALPPQYPFGNDPAQPNPTTPGLSRPNSGGGGGATVGYKRSNDAADIKAAELTDAPGYSGAINPANADLNFDFETVAKGEDTQTIYGALKWNFQIRAGAVTGETASATGAQSATFDAALSKHRDFYVHEPVIFYFEFDSDTMSAGEIGKIDEFTDYMKRFPDAKISLTGFADHRGNAAHNADLSLRRAEKVEKELTAKGIPASQLEGIIVGAGATEDFTPDATTDQDKDANRRGNRRVVATFSHVPAAPGGAGAGAGAGAAGAGAPAGVGA